MCDIHNDDGPVTPAEALPANLEWKGEALPLEPVDELSVLTVCDAQRLTGITRLHAVVGGFHLTGPLFEPIIGDTVDALERLAPDVIVPAHCTGWKATQSIARRLPGAFTQNCVGTTFRFTAAAGAVTGS